MDKQYLVEITADSRYKVNRKIIRSTIEKVLKVNKVAPKTAVSVMIVGDRKMKQLNKDYRQIDSTTDVLSFPLETSDAKPFVKPPDYMLILGDIVISYPTAVSEAGRDNLLVDQILAQLVEHGLMHLLGYDHDDSGNFYIKNN